MDTFTKNGLNITLETEQELKQESSSILNKYYQKFINDITKIIDSNIKGISDNKLESIIDNYLNEELKHYFKSQVNKINKTIETSFKNLIYLLNNSKSPKDKLIEEYKIDIDEIIRKFNLEPALVELRNDFLRQLYRKIYAHFDDYGIAENHHIENAQDEIRIEVKAYLTQKFNNLNIEHKDLINKVLTDLKNKISNNIIEKNYLETNEKPKVLSDLDLIIELTNYEIIEKDGKFNIKDKNTGELNELIFNNNIVAIKDKNVGYKVQNYMSVYVDVDKNKAMTINKDASISVMCTPKNEYVIRIEKKDDKWVISYGNKELKNIIEINVILEKISKDYPNYYSMITKDEYIKNLINEIKAYKEENDEIIIKENGKLEINQKKEEQLKNKLELFGYEPIVTSEGLKVIDLTTNETYKVIEKNNNYILEGLAENNNFNLNYNIVSENKISTGINRFNKNNITYYIDNELNKIHYHKDKTIYKINLKNKENICKKVENGKETVAELTEILELINEDMPYLAKYIKNKSTKVKTNSVPTK